MDDKNNKIPKKIEKTKVDFSKLVDLRAKDPYEAHAIIFTVIDAAGFEVMRWGQMFGTFDAADAQRIDIVNDIRNKRGENPWADIARLTKCPNPAKLREMNNLHLYIVPGKNKEQENDQSS